MGKERGTEGGIYSKRASVKATLLFGRLCVVSSAQSTLMWLPLHEPPWLLLDSTHLMPCVLFSFYFKPFNQPPASQI